MRNYLLTVLTVVTVAAYTYLRYFQPPIEVQVSIVHTSDLYGNIYPTVPYEGPYKNLFVGGSPMLASAITQIRQEVEDNKADMLLLDSGNALFATKTKLWRRGETIIKIMNHLQYDAMAIGNGEMDVGVDGLNKLATTALFPFLGANIIDQDTKTYPAVVAPYTIKEVNGIRIGIIGISNPLMKTICPPERVKSWDFLPVEDKMREALTAIKNRGVDYVVVLSDLWDEERETQLAEKFASNINLIIATSRAYEKWDQPRYVAGVPIIKSHRDIKILGRFNVFFDRESHRPLRHNWQLYDIYSKNYTPDPEVLKIMHQEGPVVNQEMRQSVLAFSTMNFPYEELKESAFGNLITDIVREETGSDAVMINSGALRGMPLGMITEEKLEMGIPYEDNVVQLQLSGREIKNILEQSFAQMYEQGILQVSGLTFKLDLDGNVGDKVSQIAIGDRPLEMETLYKVATITFLLQRGDNYDGFAKGKLVKSYSKLRAIVRENFLRRKQIKSKIDGRMSKTTTFLPRQNENKKVAVK